MRNLRFADRTVVFDDRTGRFVVLGPRTEVDEEFLARDARIGSAGMLSSLSPTWIPSRKHRPLLLPERMSLLGPDPHSHPPGGHLWRLVPLDLADLALWNALDGRASVGEVAERARVGTDEALLRLGRLARFEVQAIQLRPERLPEAHPQRSLLISPPRERNVRSPEMFDGRGGTSLGAFHHQIADDDTRFDHAETTLAHAFGVPHPALDGETWGQRLAAVLARRVTVADSFVVEVGGGTGQVAADFLGVVTPARYLRIDRSPALLAAQGKRAPSSTGILGDALALPLPDGSVDVLIANEVIADLPAARAADGWRNVGAETFVREIARVLRQGGLAYVSEFGGEDEVPEETDQLDHPEVSIDFGGLARVAMECGLSASIEPLAAFMNLRMDARWLWRPHFAAIRALDGLHGRRPTESRAWTPGTLPLPEAVVGLRWVTLHEEGPGPLPARFCALILRKP